MHNPKEKYFKHPYNKTNGNSSKIESIKIPELIAILTIAIGTWYALLNFILDFSDYSESPLIVLGLSVIHFINTLLIVCCLISLYYNTVSIGGVNIKNLFRLAKINDICIKLVKLYWLPILTFCGIEYIILSFTNDNTGDWMLSICFGLTLLITVTLFCFLFKITNRDLYKYIINKTHLYNIISFTILSFFLFCIVMILIFSKVGYKFEKEYYRKNENPILSISRRGYILKPSVKSIKFENLETSVTTNTIAKFIEINPESVKKNGGYILLTYEIQIVGLNRDLQIEVPFLEELHD